MPPKVLRWSDTLPYRYFVYEAIDCLPTSETYGKQFMEMVKAYEFYFDTPVVVTDTFFVGYHTLGVDGRQHPYCSWDIDSTGYAYMIYVGEEFYTMNVQGEGETIPDFRPYEAQLSEAQSYTLLQIKRDRFTPLAFAGGVVTMLGLLLAFYLQTRKLWALQNEDGTWTVCGSSPKGGALFADRVTEAAEQLKNES